MTIVRCLSAFLLSMFCNIFCKHMVKDKSQSPPVWVMICFSIIFSVLAAFDIRQYFGEAVGVIEVFLLICMQIFGCRKKNRFSAVCFCMFFAAFANVCDRLADFAVSAFLDKLSFTAYVIISSAASRLLILVILIVLCINAEKTKITMKNYLVAIGLFSLSLYMLCESVEAAFGVYAEIYADGYVLPSMFYIFMLVLMAVLFYGVAQFESKQREHENLLLIEQKNRMLEQSLNDNSRTFELWRKSIHDYKNNIITLSQLAEENDLSGIKEYLAAENSLLSEKVFVIKTGNTCVDAIINIKLAAAQQAGISFSVTAVVPQECGISDFYFCSILGNLIDNAIEAVKNESEPYINVIITSAKSNFLIIKIINKFSGELKLFTHKNKPVFHGIGLKSVNSTVEELNGSFNLEVSEPNKFEPNKFGKEVTATVLIPFKKQNPNQ